MKSNLNIKSNLMIDDAKHQNERRWLAGDLRVQIYPEFKDVRVIQSKLSPEQIIEYRQYLVCQKCKRTCAGTCEVS